MDDAAQHLPVIHPRLVDGKSIKQITREFDLARNTVRRVLRSGETAFSYERAVQPRPKLGAWTETLDRRLAANDRLARGERLDLVRIYEDLRAEGFAGATTPGAATPRLGSASGALERRMPTYR